MGNATGRGATQLPPTVPTMKQCGERWASLKEQQKLILHSPVETIAAQDEGWIVNSPSFAASSPPIAGVELLVAWKERDSCCMILLNCLLCLSMANYWPHTDRTNYTRRPTLHCTGVMRCDAMQHLDSLMSFSLVHKTMGGMDSWRTGRRYFCVSIET